MLSCQLEVNFLDKKAFFHKIITFTTSVHSVTHEFTKKAKPEEVTPVQFSILEYIAVSQPVTPSQISDCQHMSLPNTSRELKKLIEKHLIEKWDNTEDRRKQLIRLSKDGERMMNEAFISIENDFFKRIQDHSKDDLEAIERALEILQTKLFF